MRIDEQRNKTDQRTTVFFLPGLAAETSIFQGIELNPLVYRSIYLSWIEPHPGESLASYVRRMLRGSDPTDSVLVAVSLGVLPAAEIARQFQTRGVVLISTISTSSEMPWKFRLLRYSWLRSLLPYGALQYWTYWRKLRKIGIFRERIERYDRFMGLNTPNYLRWCLDRFTLDDWGVWNTPVIHLHGERDRVFPIDRIRKCRRIPDGTHAVLVQRPEVVGRLLNESLDELEKSASR